MGLTWSLCELQDNVVLTDQDVLASSPFWCKGNYHVYFFFKQYSSESGGLSFLDHTEGLESSVSFKLILSIM